MIGHHNVYESVGFKNYSYGYNVDVTMADQKIESASARRQMFLDAWKLNLFVRYTFSVTVIMALACMFPSSYICIGRRTIVDGTLSASVTPIYSLDTMPLTFPMT